MIEKRLTEGLELARIVEILRELKLGSEALAARLLEVHNALTAVDFLLWRELDCSSESCLEGLYLGGHRRQKNLRPRFSQVAIEAASLSRAQLPAPHAERLP